MKKTGKLLQIDDPKSDIAIKVEHVSKSFRLPHNRQSSIKGTLVNLVSGGDRTFETQEVLKDISFEIKKGEFFGIVGRNGSGKSTLLKMLAGIYKPSHGTITVNGSLTPFIELGVGFNPELTGRENVFLNGALLGFNDKEVADMYDDIVNFAELERFMDQKLKNYSSGMQVRLAFSIAIRAHSDILLFDEVLAVGDASFQQKCYETFADIKKSGVTVVLVTHDMSAVQRFCDTAILIEKGIIKYMGDPLDVADKYLEENFEDQEKIEKKINEINKPDDTISKVSIRSSKSLGPNVPLKISFIVKPPKNSTGAYHIGLQIFRNDGVYVFGTNTKNASLEPQLGVKKFTINLEQNLAPGSYTVTLAYMNDQATSVIKYRPKVAQFNVKQQTNVQGVVLLNDVWRVENDKTN